MKNCIFNQNLKSIYFLLYLLTVLILDHLIPANLKFLSFIPSFDCYKFTFWLLIPLFFTFRTFDYSYLKLKGMHLSDFIIILIIASLGIGAMSIIPFFDSLNSYYNNYNFTYTDTKINYFLKSSTWIFSWLLGWEFLHRYLALKYLSHLKLKYIILTIALIEGLYHYNKPTLEFLAVFIFSSLLTTWAIKRKSLILPLLAHLIIEVELVLFQVIF